MLKSIGIQNFKAIGKMAHIPLKPITLIFGPNSAGKSSIIQSLLMLKQSIGGKAKEILQVKGEYVDLGTYKEFIYRHNLNNELSFKFELVNFLDTAFNLEADVYSSLPEWDDLIDKLNTLLDGQPVFLVVNIKSVNGKVKASKFDFLVGSRSSEPVISYCSMENNKFYAEVNASHDFWQKFVDTVEKDQINQSITEILQQSLEKNKNGLSDEEFSEYKKMVDDLLRKVDSAEKVPQRVQVQFEDMAQADIVSVGFLPRYLGLDLVFGNDLKTRYELLDINDILSERIAIDCFKDSATYLSQASGCIEFFLNHFEHIEPLRKAPQRYYSKVDDASLIKVYGEESFFDYLSDENKIELVNETLERIGVGYKISLRSFAEVSDDLCSINLINIHTGISSPLKDVGVGVSQVLPIVISCLSGKKRTFAIEQPELHLHPAAQTELGDLFINSALGENKNSFVIETHSEHLILRLLRRIRETADGELPEGCTPIKPEDVAVLYVQPGKDGAEVIELPVNEDGQFDRPWPNGFFAERAKELF